MHILRSGSLALLAAAACGGDDTNSNDTTDISADDGTDNSPRIDAAIDSPAANCSVVSAFGTPTLTNPIAVGDALPPVNYAEFQGDLNADVEPDFVAVQLFAGLGGLAGGLALGTYTISGDEAQYATCGICVLIYADGTTDDPYLATSGTVTIASVAGELTGTVANASFEHVTILQEAPFTSTAVGDGCASSITNLSFTAPIVLLPPPRPFAPAATGKRKVTIAVPLRAAR